MNVYCVQLNLLSRKGDKSVTRNAHKILLGKRERRCLDQDTPCERDNEPPGFIKYTQFDYLSEN